MRRIFLALIFAAFAAACATASAPSPSAPMSVTLERTRCFGFCPDYTVTIRETGEVMYNGRNFVGVTGEQRAQAAPADVARLHAMIDRANFFSLRDEYRANISDIPNFRVTVVQAGRTKSVLDYGGQGVGMPAIVRDIQDEIDRVAGTNRWVPRPEGTPLTR